MKTFNDLKIGDKVFSLTHSNGTNSNKIDIYEIYYISIRSFCVYIRTINIFNSHKYCFRITPELMTKSVYLKYFDISGFYMDLYTDEETFMNLYADEKVFLHDFKRYEDFSGA